MEEHGEQIRAKLTLAPRELDAHFHEGQLLQLHTGGRGLRRSQLVFSCEVKRGERERRLFTFTKGKQTRLPDLTSFFFLSFPFSLLAQLLYNEPIWP